MTCTWPRTYEVPYMPANCSPRGPIGANITSSTPFATSSSLIMLSGGRAGTRPT